MTVIIRNFIFKEQSIHGLNPFSYIFTQDVLAGRINSSYLLGILLNIGLIVLCVLLSYMKFNRKDFLGDKE
jgi:ABC-type transport system involved in multi-copper enzyme maturation permease subunit